MRRCWKPSSLLWLILLAGCASQAPVPVTTPGDPLEQNAINAVQLGQADNAWQALDAALARYRSLDDLKGQWRIHHLQARLALQEGAEKRLLPALASLEEISDLISGDPYITYATELMAGRITGNSERFEAALRYAPAPLYRAVAMAYLGEVDAALQLAGSNPGGPATERAFVFYAYARANRSAEHYQLALSEYRRAEDSRGIADSLFSLAHLAADANRQVQARDYANRAARVLEATGDESRAQAVRSWVARL